MKTNMEIGHHLAFDAQGFGPLNGFPETKTSNLCKGWLTQTINT